MLGCCDLRAQLCTWHCWTSGNLPWSINPACPDPSSPLQFRKFIFSIHFFSGNYFLHASNYAYAPVWGNCQSKHTLSPCSPGLEVYLHSQDETQVSWFRRYLFSGLANGFVYYTRPAVCQSVLLRRKELWFSKRDTWWGLELHNLALQSKQMEEYSVLIRLSVIFIPLSSVRWVLWICDLIGDWLFCL